MELTIYLGQKIKEYADRSARQLVVAWGSECQATPKDVGRLQSNQEEADTKMILHTLDATANGATQLQIHSPDTDVFVLALRRYPELCENTLFVKGRGQYHRMIELKPIVQTLGPEKIVVFSDVNSFNVRILSHGDSQCFYSCYKQIWRKQGSPCRTLHSSVKKVEVIPLFKIQLCIFL